ncbi:hypothetical protein LJC20_01975 [Eubacteriales bacterium OttesenSCG-928-M02]|nr:hypothetical protein [Eubacteriales bacterium OttesenSCG-928-M02]
MRSLFFAVAALLFFTAFSLYPPLFAHAEDDGGYQPGDTGIIDEAKNKDIYVNVDGEMLDTLSAMAGQTITSEKLAEDIKAYLLSKGESYNDANIRVRSNTAVIDTTDLSNWYVFDHYDDGQGTTTSYGGINAATTGFYKPNEEPDKSYFTNMRKYYQVRDIRSYASSSGNIPFSEVLTIEQLVTNGAQYGMTNDTDIVGLGSCNVRKLREHIYSYKDNNGSHMIFMGYGANARSGNASVQGYNYLTDFLFYPATSAEEKTIEFDIKSDNVRTHSMAGAGFLINTGIEEREESGNIVQYIHGYMLYIKFLPPSSNGAPTHAEFYLYKINPNVKADDFHDRMAINSTKLATDATYVSLIGTCRSSYNNSNQHQTDENADAIFRSGSTFKTSMHLRVVFDNEKFELYASDAKGATETKAVFTYYADGNMANDAASNVSKTRANFSTGSFGFGPLVDYTGSGHTCATTSVYRFTNLEMYFKVDVFSALLDTDFFSSQNTDRFFVNLLSKKVDDTNGDFWQGIARLRGEQIFYVTNSENDVIGDAGANRNNGKTLLPGTDYTTYQGFIQAMGEYLHSPGAWEDGALPPMDTAEPYAAFSIVGRDQYLENTDASIALIKVEEQRMADAPVTVYLQNRSMVKAPSTIKELKATIIKPDETEQTLTIPYDGTNALQEYQLFTLDGTSTQIGTYTVKLVAVAVDENGQNPVESAEVVKHFNVIQDTIAPTVTLKTADEANINGETGIYEGNRLTLTLADVGWGVVAYQFGYGESAESATFTQDNYVKLEDMWASYSLTIPAIGARNENLYVKAWDWVGNLYTYQLPVNPRILGITIDGENDFVSIPASTFNTTLTDAYITGQVVELTGFTYGKVGEFSITGFAVEKNAATPLERITMDGDKTLYPVVRDTTVPTASLDDSLAAHVESGIYMADHIKINLADAGIGLTSYQVGYGTADDNISYGDAQSLANVESQQVVLTSLPGGKQNLYVRVVDGHGNETIFKQAINPRIYTVSIDKDNAFGVDLSAHSYPADTNTYAIDETATPPTVAGYPTVNGYQLIGFHTNRLATAGLSTIAIAGNATIYPILSDIEKPVITITPATTDSFVTEIDLTATIADNHQVASQYYYLVEYNNTATLPTTLTDGQMEALVSNAGGTWQSFTGNSIQIPGTSLTSGKQYQLLVKAVDASGNLAYGLSRGYRFDIVNPVLKVGDTPVTTSLTHSLSTTLTFSDDFSLPENLTITYVKNGQGSAVPVNPADCTLVPPAEGADTYLFTVADERGNRITRIIIIKSYQALLSPLEDLDVDNVTADAGDALEEIKNSIESILTEEDATTGATQQQLEDLANALQKIVDLGKVLKEVADARAALEDVLSQVDFDGVTPAEKDMLADALVDAKDLLAGKGDNLTAAETERLKDVIKELEDLITFIDAEAEQKRLENDGLTLNDLDGVGELIHNYEDLLNRNDLPPTVREEIEQKLDDLHQKKENLEQATDFVQSHDPIVDMAYDALTPGDYQASIDAFEDWNTLTAAQKELAYPGKVDETEEHLEKMYFKATQDGRKTTEIKGLEDRGELTVDGLPQLFTDATIFTPENQQLVLDGGRVHLQLVFQSKGQTLSQEEKTVLEQALNQEKDRVTEVVDISLFKIESDRDGAILNTTNLTHLGSSLRVVIPLTTQQQGYARLRLFRIHESQVDYLEDLDRDRASYTARTNRFSTYVFVYDGSIASTGDVDHIPWLMLFIVSYAILAIGVVLLLQQRLNERRAQEASGEQ